MAFDLGSKFTRKAQQFVSDASSNALPGNDPLSKIGRNILDASGNRLIQAGLNFAGANIPGYNNISTTIFRDNDIRVRLALSPASGNILYKDDANRILKPLLDTGGILFPYTPNVSIGHSASYGSFMPTHSNYAQPSYSHSTVEMINIDGYFTANTADEARYVLAVLHFLRSAYKMFFGADSQRGTPPPVLRFSGYGPFMYNSVPVVLQNFTEVLLADRDYIEVPLATAPDAATKTMVPTFLPVNISLIPVYSRQQLADFSLASFASGGQIGSPGKSGGFI